MEDGTVLIATASSTTPFGQSNILLWKWQSTRQKSKKDALELAWSFNDFIVFIFKTIVVLAAMAFFAGSIEQIVRVTFSPSKLTDIVKEWQMPITIRKRIQTDDHLNRYTVYGDFQDGRSTKVPTATAVGSMPSVAAAPEDSQSSQCAARSMGFEDSK